MYPMKQLVALLALCSCLVPAVASASPGLNVETPAYARAVRVVEAWGPSFPECEAHAEDEVECEAEGLYGLECDAKLARVYLDCVGRDVCDHASQGWLEDDGISSEGLGDMFGACLTLVSIAGGAS